MGFSFAGLYREGAGRKPESGFGGGVLESDSKPAMKPKKLREVLIILRKENSLMPVKAVSYDGKTLYDHLSHLHGMQEVGGSNPQDEFGLIRLSDRPRSFPWAKA